MSHHAAFAEDGPLVGTPAILSSPNVSEPNNAVNDTIPTPSVYADCRGEIHNALLVAGGGAPVGRSGGGSGGGSGSAEVTNGAGRRINILHTRAGVMRSGDIHPNVQCDFIFAGSVEVWTLKPDGTTLKRRYCAKDYVEIPPFVPHIFNFVKDTVMAEWWEGRGVDGDGSSDDFRAWFYLPYRRIVDDSINKGGGANVGKGEMKVFSEVKGGLDNILSTGGDIGKSSTWILLGGAALVLTGFALGMKAGHGKKYV